MNPSTDRVPPSGDSRRWSLATLSDVLGPWTAVAAVTAFVTGSLATWRLQRQLVWPALKADLETAAVDVVAVTPWDAILLQVRIALVVGAVLAVEVVVYSARSVLVPADWRPVVSPSVRAVSIVVGLVAFPAGAVVGYDYLVAAAVEALAGDSAWTVTRWAELAYYGSILSGVATQVALVSVALGAGRQQSPG